MARVGKKRQTVKLKRPRPVVPNPEGVTPLSVAAMMRRSHPSDQVQFGRWIEDLLTTQTGDLIMETLYNLLHNELLGADQNDSRKLGRAQAYQRVLKVLEDYINDGRSAKKQLQEEAADEMVPETDIHD